MVEKENNIEDFLLSKYSIGNLISILNRELDYYFNHTEYSQLNKNLSENISRMEGLYLLLLNSNPNITQYQIANVLRADITLVAKFTRKLINKGYIEKKVDPSDKRKKILNLTNEAKKVMPNLVKVYDSFNKSAFEGFTEEENKVFSSLLLKMLHNVYISNLEVKE